MLDRSSRECQRRGSCLVRWPLSAGAWLGGDAMRSRAMIGALALGTVLVTSLAGAREEAEAPRRDAPGDRAIVGVRGDVDSLNIYTASTILSQEVADLLFLHLATE